MDSPTVIVAYLALFTLVGFMFLFVNFVEKEGPVGLPSPASNPPARPLLRKVSVQLRMDKGSMCC